MDDGGDKQTDQAYTLSLDEEIEHALSMAAARDHRFPGDFIAAQTKAAMAIFTAWKDCYTQENAVRRNEILNGTRFFCSSCRTKTYWPEIVQCQQCGLLGCPKCNLRGHRCG